MREGGSVLARHWLNFSVSMLTEHIIHMVFVLGINVGLRAGDLLSIKIKDVMHSGMTADTVRMKEEKTGKLREFTLNKSAKDVIK